MKLNEYVTSYLQYYSAEVTNPEYALLINGKWGSGKTFLVDNHYKQLKKKDKNAKILQISLYGLTSINDIEMKFFELLNPVLSSKPMVIGKQLAKGLLRATIKVDLDGDGKPDGSANIGIPDVELKPYLLDKKNSVLVFDDLERSHIPIDVLFGYINYFVEKEGHKVVLIADETKLLTSSESDVAHYKSAKEKLIGRTLTVEPDVNNFFQGYLDSLEDSAFKKILNAHKNTLISVFEKSTHNNLRSLRKIFLDLERLWNNLNDNHQQNFTLIQSVFFVYSLLSMELYAGTFSADEIPEVVKQNSGFSSLFDEKKPPGKFAHISLKYENNLLDLVFDADIWTDLFNTGYLDNETINQALDIHSLANHREPKDWEKLWGIYELNDDDFLSLRKSVLKDFKVREFKTIGEIKHAFGILLSHCHYGLSELTAEELLVEGKAYLNDVFSDGSVQVPQNRQNDMDRMFGSYGGKAYNGNDCPEFKAFTKAIEKHLIKYRDDKDSEHAKSILSLLSSGNQNDLYEMLVRGSSKLGDKKVFHHLGPAELFDTYISAPPANQIAFCDLLVSRYNVQYRGCENPFTDEYPVMSEFIRLLEGYCKDKAQLPTILRIRRTINNVGAVIDNIKPTA